MNKLVEIRNQEFMCRERALLDSERKVFWLAKAEEWGQCALDEIAFHFRECNHDMGIPRRPRARAFSHRVRNARQSLQALRFAAASGDVRARNTR